MSQNVRDVTPHPRMECANARSGHAQAGTFETPLVDTVNLPAGQQIRTHADCPGRPLASRVLGQRRLSCSAIREGDRGHAKDGREGVCACMLRVVGVISGG